MAHHQPVDLRRYTCPQICPRSGDSREPATNQNGGPAAERQDFHASGPYVPGQVQPPTSKTYPPGAPPLYLPQPTDTTSGDFLTMGPIDPWAAGHIDWTPHAGSTGVRPVVDKYSLTRYSTGEWRANNEYMLRAIPNNKSDATHAATRKVMKDINDKIENAKEKSNKELDSRVKELRDLKRKVEAAVKGITDELETLDRDRARLKGASRILMLPEAISRECLEIRTHRLEPDLVRDEAEQELIREVAIVGEIRKTFNETLIKVERQMEQNRAAKAAIEQDWSDKMVSLKVDKKNSDLSGDASIILFHPGVVRWPENATPYEYYKHYCAENIRNCEEVKKKSENLRNNLMVAIIKGGQDLKNQAERTNAALEETIKIEKDLVAQLELVLKDTLQKIADTERLIGDIKQELINTDQKQKLAMTRLHGRNYDRPNVENVRDNAQYAIMDEAKLVKDVIEDLVARLRVSENLRADLMQYRGVLEKDIACKRKSLNIEDDRFRSIRAHLPPPEEYLNIV